MSTNRSGSGILLDWFNVSYRSVLLTVILVIVLAAGGWFAWSQFFEAGPRRAAAGAISQAESRLDLALEHEGEAKFDEAIASARAALSESRASFGNSEYDDARHAAERSDRISRMVIDMAKGEAASAKVVRFYRIEGDVRVKGRGTFSWESADMEMALQVGDMIKTSSKASAQIVHFDGTVTTIQPGSLLEIRELYENPVTKVRKVSEKLNWGEVTASTQKRNVDGSFHEVSTDGVSARSDQEGEFRVSADREDKTTTLDVFTGKVQVAGKGTKEMVAEGERLKASADGRLGTKEILPGVPKLISPADEMVFVYENPGASTTRLAWDRMPLASNYRLLISDRFLFTDPRYDALRGETEVVIEGVNQGAYYWKVAAISPAGVAGPFSETRRFRVTTQKIRDVTDTTPPKLEISDFLQTGAMVIINGRTEPGAQVWIDNEKIDVADDGSFYTVVRLSKEGMNEMKFVAQDAAGNEHSEKHVAYVESY
jgi:hypothetical protein